MMRETTNEKIELSYTDQCVFPAVMQEADLCWQLLERIFPDRKIRDLHLHGDFSKVTPEKVLAISATGRGIRLDVLFEDTDATYDIEMQLRNYAEMPKRTRYYHSMMDASSLKRGDDFSKLKAQYVIFICSFDPFGEGEPIYDFQMIFRKTGLCLDEKTYTIFINTKADESLIPEALRPYCRYVNSGTPDENDKFIKDLHDKVIEVSNDPEWRGVIMKLRDEIRMQYRDEIEAAAMKASEEARKEAIIQGRAEGRAEGRAQGREEGRAQGREEGRAEGRAQGLAEGMAKQLVSLVREGVLSYETALSKAEDPEAFKTMFEVENIIE